MTDAVNTAILSTKRRPKKLTLADLPAYVARKIDEGCKLLCIILAADVFDALAKRLPKSQLPSMFDVNLVRMPELPAGTVWPQFIEPQRASFFYDGLGPALRHTALDDPSWYQYPGRPRW